MAEDTVPSAGEGNIPNTIDFTATNFRAEGAAMREGMINAGRVEQIRSEVIGKAKEGEGELGMIRHAFKSAVQEGKGNLSEISAVYNAAKQSKEKIDLGVDPSLEAAKLLNSLQAMHKQMGREYQTRVDIPGNASKDEVQKLIREQLVKDFDSVADTITDDYLMKDLYDRKTHLETIRDNLTNNYGPGAPRNIVRKSAFELARAELRYQRELRSTVDGRLGDGSLRKDLVDVYNQRKVDNTPEQFEPLDRLEDADRKQELDKHEEKIGSEKQFEGYDNLSEQDKQLFGRNLIEIRRERTALVENYKKAVTMADPESICDINNQLRELNLDEKRASAELRMKIKGKQIGDRFTSMGKLFPKMGDEMIEKGINFKDIRKHVVSAVKEIAGNFDDLTLAASNRIDVALLDQPIEEIDKAAGAIEEVVGKIRVYIEEKFGDKIDKVKQVYNRAREAVQAVASVVKNEILEVKRLYRGVKNELAATKYEASARWALTKEEFKKNLGVDLGILAGGNKDRAKERRKDFRDEFTEKRKEIDRRANEMRDNNPLFAELDSKLMNQVREKKWYRIIEPVTEATETSTDSSVSESPVVSSENAVNKPETEKDKKLSEYQKELNNRREMRDKKIKNMQDASKKGSIDAGHVRSAYKAVFEVVQYASDKNRDTLERMNKEKDSNNVNDPLYQLSVEFSRLNQGTTEEIQKYEAAMDGKDYLSASSIVSDYLSPVIDDRVKFFQKLREQLKVKDEIKNKS